MSHRACDPPRTPFAVGKRSCSGGAAAAGSLSGAGSDAASDSGGGNDGELLTVGVSN